MTCRLDGRNYGVRLIILGVRESRREKTMRHDSLGQLGIVCERDRRGRMHNVGDVQLLIQPLGPVRVERETRNKSFGGTESVIGYTPPWEGPTHVA